MAIRFSFDDGTFELGRWQGAPIVLHAGFFLTAATLACPFWMQMSLRGLALAAMFIVILFGSILAHEFGHAIVARRCRIPSLAIEVHMCGGRVLFPRRARSRGEDFAITLAGPMVNVGIGLAALALLAVLPPPPEFIHIGSAVMPAPKTPDFVKPVLRATAYVNLGLAIFNLMPAFPLDGGHLAHLLIEARWGKRIATLVVGAFGVVFSFFTGVLLLATLSAGMPLWLPVDCTLNWRAFRGARAGAGGWDRFAAEEAWAPATSGARCDENRTFQTAARAVPEFLTARARRRVIKHDRDA